MQLFYPKPLKFVSLCYALLMFILLNVFCTGFSDTLSIPTQNFSPSLCQMKHANLIFVILFFIDQLTDNIAYCDIEIIVFLTFIHRSVDGRHHLDQWGTGQPTGAVSGDHWGGRHSVGHHWGRGCSPAPGNHRHHLSQQLSWQRHLCRGWGNACYLYSSQNRISPTW